MFYSKFIDPFLKQVLDSIQTPVKDIYGDITYSIISTNDKCRFTFKPKLLYSLQGASEVTKAIMWVRPSCSIDEGYKVVYNGVGYEVIKVENKKSHTNRLLYKRVLLR